MELTLGQATRMVEVCPKDSHYYREAMKVVEANGQARRQQVELSLRDYEARSPASPPVLYTAPWSEGQ